MRALQQLPLMADRRRVTRLALVSLCWLWCAVGGVNACGHGSSVHSMPAFVQPPDAPRPADRSQVAKVNVSADTIWSHNPFRAQGPCQGPQCERQPAPTELPISSVSDQSHDRWDAVCPANLIAPFAVASWSALEDSAMPQQVYCAIFHPPRVNF